MIIFTDHGQVNGVGKSLSYWHVNSCDCLLTHWLLTKTILFLIQTIQRYQFRCKYLRNKTLFLNFWINFWILGENLNIFQKNMSLLAFLFWKLRTPKTLLEKYLKSSISEDPSTSNIVKLPTHCWNLHRWTAIIFIIIFNWVGKSLSYWHANSWDCLLTHWLPMKRILFLI